MSPCMRALCLGAALLTPLAAHAAIPDGKIVIGILQDLPEPFATETGNGGIVAAQLAAGDFETEHMRGDAEILAGAQRTTEASDLDQVKDWLNKEHMAAVVSSAPLDVNRRIASLLAQHHVALLVAESTQGESSGFCAPNAVVWGTGPGTRARAVARVLAQRGGKRWFVLANESPLGIGGLAALHDALPALGAQVTGQAVNALGEPAVAQLDQQAAQANAQVVALAEGDGDLVTVLRAANLEGLQHRFTVAAPFARIVDIDNAGPGAADDVVVAAPFYWNTDDQTRRFAHRWADRMHGQHVTTNAATIYAATLSFLHAAWAVQDVDADKVLPALKRAPIEHTLFGTVTVRPDGQVLHDIGVYRVKQPQVITQRWDYYAPLASVPEAEAGDGTCRTSVAARAQD